MNKGKIVGKFPRVIRSDIRQRTLRELERLVEENANAAPLLTTAAVRRSSNNPKQLAAYASN